MKVKKQIFIILVFAWMTFVYSCKKETKHDIIGNWERMIVENSNTKEKEFWKFDESTITITKQDTIPGSLPYVSDSGRYIVKSGLSKKYIRTNGFSFVWYNNLDWRIEKLKDGQLIIFSDRDNYFLYLEFVKVN